MTKDALKQLIKEMVQEEVRSSLPTLLPQIMAEIFSSPQPKSSNSVKTPKITSTPTEPAANQKKPYKTYTKNELLNKVLNETVGGVPQEGSLVASSMAPSQVSVMDHVDKVPDVVANALTKNYSALLKAVDKKRSGGSIGSNVAGMM